MSEMADLRFEEAFKELETTVASLEEGELSLEEAIALFEKGQTLLAHCQEQLATAEFKVQELSLESSQRMTGEGA